MKNKIKIGIVIFFGMIIAGIVTYVVLSSSKTVTAYVPNQQIKTGTKLTKDMLKKVEISANTPGNFLRNVEAVEGLKLKNTVEADQLLYQNDFLSSWEKFSSDIEIHEDFVYTSIRLPDERAVGGLIVAGDVVDIYGLSKNGYNSAFDEKAEINGRENIGANVYPILANVKVLNTNSTLSKAQENDLSTLIDGNEGGKKDGNYYILALSYEDMKKLRQAEPMLELWMNLAPRQNEENPPLIAQMIGQSFSGLHDAQLPVQNKDGSIVEGVTLGNTKTKEVTNPEPIKIINEIQNDSSNNNNGAENVGNNTENAVTTGEGSETPQVAPEGPQQ